MLFRSVESQRRDDCCTLVGRERRRGSERDSEAGEVCSVVLADRCAEQRPAVVCKVHAHGRDGDSEIATFGEE